MPYGICVLLKSASPGRAVTSVATRLEYDVQAPGSGWAPFRMEVAMSEICLDCFNKLEGKHYRQSAVILGDDWCEDCGEYKPCIIRFRKPWERVKYFFGIRERELTEEEWEALEAEEDAMFARMMNEYAHAEGERYSAENERLKNDPDAEVPPDVDRRARELIDHFFSGGTGESDKSE